MSDVKEVLKKEIRIEQDVQKQVQEIRKIFKSHEPEDVKIESVQAILSDLAEQIVEAKVSAMFENRTKLLSADAADEFLKREYDYSKRAGTSFSVILIDIDHLKYINDEFGHVAGTKMIIEVAQVIKRAIRTSDVAARYGGDEFLVILRSADDCRHELVVDRIRRAVARINLSGVRVSVSVGAICSKDKNFRSSESLLKAADKILYAEKQNRKNVNLKK